MMKLTDKIALITGGTSGLGLATAKRFVSEGAFVFITGRRQTELDAAVTEIGDNVIGVRGDISKLSDLDDLFSVIKEKKVASTSSLPTREVEHSSLWRRSPRNISTSILALMLREPFSPCKRRCRSCHQAAAS